MKEILLEEGRKFIESEIRSVLEQRYPSDVEGQVEKSFNQSMRSASNLMVGLTSSDRAQRSRSQVQKAIDFFERAHQLREDAWAPLNAMAKCHYLLGDLRNAEVRNAQALASVDNDGSEESRDARKTSHFMLNSQIMLDQGDLEDAEAKILNAIAISPKNVHVRKAHLRILCRQNSHAIIDQLEVIESFDEFPKWAHDFIILIDGEEDFEFLNKTDEWTTVRERWLNLIQRELNKFDFSEDEIATREKKYRKLVYIAKAAGIMVCLNLGLYGFSEILDLGEVLLGSGEASGSDATIAEEGPESNNSPATEERAMGDVEPFAEMQAAGDVEPFTEVQFAGDVEPFSSIIADATLQTHPLVDADPLLHDVLLT
ncbi:MAG: hypothetical protein AAFN27_15525 [Pseudomonadota bacterium]